MKVYKFYKKEYDEPEHVYGYFASMPTVDQIVDKSKLTLSQAHTLVSSPFEPKEFWSYPVGYTIETINVIGNSDDNL